MAQQDPARTTPAGTVLDDLPPDLREIATLYRTQPVPSPGPDDIGELWRRIVETQPRRSGVARGSMLRARLRDLRGNRSRRFWLAWLVINLLGTDISYGIKVSDEQLLQEWQQGNTESLLSLLVRQYAPLLVHLARLGGDDAAAAELTRQTFLHLTADVDHYQYPAPVQPRLYALARETAQARGAADALPAQDSFRAALATLSWQQREILSLRVGQGLGVEETATLLGVPVDALQDVMVPALTHLRDILA